VNNTFTLKDDSTFEHAVEALDHGGLGFIAVVDETNLLLGILTDGDIRRSFLRKEFDLQSIINKTPEVMSEKSTQQEVISRLKTLRRRHMPLVNDRMQLKSVFSLDDITFVTRDNPVVIMAGGLGSRLGKLTKTTPKPMLNVGNRPMLQHLIEQFRDQGFRKFIFCVNYKKNIIRNYFSDGSTLGVKIEYIEEEKRLGTAGALSLIDPRINVPFFVINADILVNIDFMELLNFHLQSKSLATMCVREFQMQVPYGVINSSESNKLLSLDEKPQITFDVNAGIYLLDPSVNNYIPQNQFFDMPSLFEILIDKELQSSVFQINDYWRDIGQKEDLEQANADMQGPV
jgi:dTDP-glucose pyrophosphorylase